MIKYQPVFNFFKVFVFKDVSTLLDYWTYRSYKIRYLENKDAILHFVGMELMFALSDIKNYVSTWSTVAARNARWRTIEAAHVLWRHFNGDFMTVLLISTLRSHEGLRGWNVPQLSAVVNPDPPSDI